MRGELLMNLSLVCEECGKEGREGEVHFYNIYGSKIDRTYVTNNMWEIGRVYELCNECAVQYFGGAY